MSCWTFVFTESSKVQTLQFFLFWLTSAFWVLTWDENTPEPAYTPHRSTGPAWVQKLISHHYCFKHSRKFKITDFSMEFCIDWKKSCVYVMRSFRLLINSWCMKWSKQKRSNSTPEGSNSKQRTKRNLKSICGVRLWFKNTKTWIFLKSFASTLCDGSLASAFKTIITDRGLCDSRLII